MLPSEKLQALRHMTIVPISPEVVDDLLVQTDSYSVFEYRCLHIVETIDGEVGCNLREMARYYVTEETA